MTKIARIIGVDFGKYLLGYTRKKKTTVVNEGTELIDISTIVSNNPVFSGIFVGKIQPKYPVSSTIYFRENEVLQNANGEFATTDQGFGIAGSTDSNGKFTPNYSLPALSLTAPSAGTSFVYRSDITVEWEASANIPLVNIIIESATGIKTVSNIDATLGTYDVPMIADSGSFDFGQELVITVENSLQTIYDSVTVEIRQATLQDFRIEESESEYRVAEDIHFTAYVNYGNLPSIWAVYAQYSSDGITYEDIQYAIEGGSGLANITGCLVPAGASGTIYLRARVGDVYSDPIEALVVVPEIVIIAVDVTVDVPFTVSGTCNLAKNLRISYAKDPYTSWTVVDNSVTVQPNGTWSVDNVVISETGNFRLKAEYIQDTVAMFDDTEDVVVASGIIIIDDFESYSIFQDLYGVGGWNHSMTRFRCEASNKYEGSQSVAILNSDFAYNIAAKTLASSIDTTGKTISFYAKSKSGTALEVVLSSGSTDVKTQAFTLTADWKKYSLTYNGSWNKIKFWKCPWIDGYIDYITVE